MEPWSLFFLFSSWLKVLLRLLLYTGTSNGQELVRLVQDITLCPACSFACSLLLSLTHLYAAAAAAAAAAAVFMETPKMCQKPLISRAPLQRSCFSLGAGNVVYHHQLLYVRNWVVSGWDMIFSWGWFGEGARWIGVLVHWQNYGKQCETLLVYCSVYIFFNFYEKNYELN
jgi:hypothetical protein